LIAGRKNPSLKRTFENLMQTKSTALTMFAPFPLVRRFDS
jgi:hypothetical protein